MAHIAAPVSRLSYATWRRFEPAPGLGQTAEVLRERAAATTVSEEIRQLQLALKAAGYDPGPIDGIWGPRTQAALQAYQAGTGRPAPTPVPTRPAPAPTTAAALAVGLPGGATWWILGGVGALAGVLLLTMPGAGAASLAGPAPRRRRRRRRR